MPNNPTIAPPSVGTGRAAGSSATPCDKIDIDITKVEWIDSYPRVLQKNAPIKQPLSWTSETVAIGEDPDNFYYDGCSDKPAVYFMSSASAPNHKKIKLEVTLETKSVCGSTLPFSASGKNAKLTISFDDISFTSDHFTLPAKGASEKVTIEGDIDQIVWLKSPSFSLEYDDKGTTSTKNNVVSTSIILEAFVLYGEPATFYTEGVWIEALRFLFKKTGIDGDQDNVTSAGKITRYCHSEHGVIYDTYEGGFYFFVGYPLEDGCFSLREYLCKKNIGSMGWLEMKLWDKSEVNCYDQAGAVQSLCGALGIATEWILMVPFGFINTSNLVGIGECNNPSYRGPKVSYRLVDKYSQVLVRYPFTEHCFIRLKENRTILDATVGPHMGDESLLEYAQAVIDVAANNQYNEIIPGEQEFYPKLLTQSPLTIAAIETACKGEYKNYEHSYGYPCVGIQEIKWYGRTG